MPTPPQFLDPAAAKSLHSPPMDVGELVLRFFIVLIGMAVGVFVALFTGLATGWIQLC